MKPDIAYLKTQVSYDPLTGVFTWVVSKRGHRRAGDIAGSIWKSRRGGPYWRVKIDQRAHRAGILAWVLHYGTWPVGEIDHRDGNGLNNRIANLRDATHPQNCQNVPGAGIRYEQDRNRWLARIRVNGHEMNLGRYVNRDDAAAAYKQACVTYRGEFARGI